MLRSITTAPVANKPTAQPFLTAFSNGYPSQQTSRPFGSPIPQLLLKHIGKPPPPLHTILSHLMPRRLLLHKNMLRRLHLVPVQIPFVNRPRRNTDGRFITLIFHCYTRPAFATYGPLGDIGVEGFEATIVLEMER